MNSGSYNQNLPEPHARFLANLLERLSSDPRIAGVAAGGSFLTNSIDEYSDLDLIIAVEPEAYDSVMEQRHSIASELGPLLAGFTGEHVGEPRLLICLYGPPLLHVDLKFINLNEGGPRVEDPVVLFERDGRLTAALSRETASYPNPDLQWIEDRFWVWIHYAAGKIGRGELMEAYDFLSFIRVQVLGPLALMERGARPTGVRKIEFAAPDLARQMTRTMPAYDAASCLDALAAASELYRKLRDARASDSLVARKDAEAAAISYIDAIREGCN